MTTAAGPTLVLYRVDNLPLLREHLQHLPGRVVVLDQGLLPGTALAEMVTSAGGRAEPASQLLPALNRVLAELTGDVVVMDAGLRPMSPEWAGDLRAAAYEDGVALAGPRMRDGAGQLLHAGLGRSDRQAALPSGSGEEDIGQATAVHPVFALPLACLYLPAELRARVGEFPAALVPDAAAVSYCRRAAGLGFGIRCAGTVTMMGPRTLELAGPPTEAEDGPELAWHSLLSPFTGYGLSSHELFLALDTQGTRLRFRSIRPGWDDNVAHPRLREIMARPWRAGCPVEVVYYIAPYFKHNTGRYRIGYTMIETDGLPADWVIAANAMDELWVPSEFNRVIFQASGVTVPMRVMPLGVDPRYFHPGIRGHKERRGSFTFLSVFEWSDRKAPDVLLRAFNDEFRAGEPVTLLLHVRLTDPSIRVDERVRALGLHARAPIIVLANASVAQYQLGCLYRSADAFVLPTRGEGWGLPIIEAMACGLPVIATDWSAHRDFFNAGNGYPLTVEAMVPAQTAVAAHATTYPGFRWAQPSYEHLRSLMRHVYEHREEARTKGALAATDVAAHWTWDHAAAAIRQRVKELIG